MLLFKLAFHTYEALSNKTKLKDRMKKWDDPSADPQDTTTELDLASNDSDESTVTTSGPSGPQKEKKIEKYNESLDVKLNQALMKW